MKHKTISDIAREAGVSKATVSRVLTHPELVKPATQERVKAVMEKHEYVPNHLAQSLAGNPTKTIGVVIDELSNFFFIEVAEGIGNILSPLGYSMLLVSSRWIEEEETRLVKSLISSQVDGVLLAPVAKESRALQLLKASQTPCVIINQIPSDTSLSFVAGDDLEGGRIAAALVNEQEAEQVIVITGFAHQSVEDRVAGFKEVLDSRFLYKRYRFVETQADGAALVTTLIRTEELEQKKTILFVTNDNVAIGIVNELVEQGISIPEQVMVIGYDNIRATSFCRIPLTTVSQSTIHIGEQAAKTLLQLINKERTEALHNLIQPVLIRRHSL
ncbi:MAG TPA: LacI family DNA-binding transcriptional regulator [Sphaerochaeta sp.]|jgi:DNA-binding LacI/PurR family transcriptional regulator|nr:LacI family DNA-binding transcriptional regulator [Sphaerochaeta sp.]HQB54394.1 LacI family DNA-binding transcriptional regulator [Sphaerochaeta sp.]